MSLLKFCSGVEGERCGNLFHPAANDGGRCPSCRQKHDRRRYVERRAQGYQTRCHAKRHARKAA